MGMTIEEAINRVQPYAHPYCVCIQITGEEAHQVSNAIMVLANTSQKYQMMQADYETRLKADMVAMLTDIQLEIEEKKFLESSCSFMDKTEEKNYAVYTDDISNIIQQKIDALKAENEGAEHDN